MCNKGGSVFLSELDQFPVSANNILVVFAPGALDDGLCNRVKYDQTLLAVLNPPPRNDEHAGIQFRDALLPVPSKATTVFADFGSCEQSASSQADDVFTRTRTVGELRENR